MKTKIAACFALLTSVLGAAEKLPGESFDYNFDGHMDYRILTVANAKASQFDVYIFDPALGKHVKDKTLSGTVYPYPDPKTKRVLCIVGGGHSGALFVGEAYRWNGKNFEFEFSVKQEYVQIGGRAGYVRAKAKLVDGKPQIISIEPGDPEWDEKGMGIE